MKQQLSYQKVYSGLNGLREAKTVTYALTEETVWGVPLYGIRVTEEGADGSEWDAIPPFTEERKRAESLLTLLFENAVPAVHCRAVINDACTAYDGIGWNDYGEGAGSASHCG